MRFPKRVPQGGTIGFVAPSFGCSIEPYRSSFDASLKMWEKAGYKTELGPNCYANEGIGISSTPESCARELAESYVNHTSNAIISCGGGELMCEILDHVDFDRIKEADPKWYMGYSDNTNFTFTLTTMCDVASIYGPCAANFGRRNMHQSIIDAMSIFADTGSIDGKDHSEGDFCSFSGYGMWEKESLRDEEHPFEPLNLTEKTVLHRFTGDGGPLAAKKIAGIGIPGDPDEKMMDSDTEIRNAYIEEDHIEMNGRLLGGCLDCLVNLCGTKYDQVKSFNDRYAEDGILWFLEACDLNMMSIRRAMWELEHAGWFDKAKGFIIGRPAHFDEPMMGLDQYAAVYDIISHHHVPILMDADVGHLSPMVPLITGSYAHVEAEDNDWSVRMELR